jgi:hypothetical protein
LLHFLVRLACVRHAASVDSEPGSNSRLKPDGLPDGSQGRRPARQNELRRARGNLTVFVSCEIHSGRPECFQRHPAEGQRSHDWHVQPVVKDRTAARLSGAFQSSPARCRSACLSSKLASPTDPKSRRRKPYKLSVTCCCLSTLRTTRTNRCCYATSAEHARSHKPVPGQRQL